MHLCPGSSRGMFDELARRHSWEVVEVGWRRISMTRRVWIPSLLGGQRGRQGISGWTALPHFLSLEAS